MGQGPPSGTPNRRWLPPIATGRPFDPPKPSISSLPDDRENLPVFPAQRGGVGGDSLTAVGGNKPGDPRGASPFLSVSQRRRVSVRFPCSAGWCLWCLSATYSGCVAVQNRPLLSVSHAGTSAPVFYLLIGVGPVGPSFHCIPMKPGTCGGVSAGPSCESAAARRRGLPRPRGPGRAAGANKRRVSCWCHGARDGARRCARRDPG